MNSKASLSSLSSLWILAILFVLSVGCKQPKGREWDNAYPDQPGTLDVDGPPRVRADQKWLDRRTKPDPVVEEEKKKAEAHKKDGAAKSKDAGKKDGN